MKRDKTILSVDKILNLSNGSISYIKLIKLLYLIDRALLQIRGYSLTGDNYVAMKLGPVTSETYASICDLKANPIEKEENPSDYWENYFEIVAPKESQKKVNIAQRKNRDENLIVKSLSLNEMEKKILEEAVLTYKDFNYSQMIDFTHDNCQEWVDPYPYRVYKIYNEDILYQIHEADNKLYPFKTNY